MPTNLVYRYSIEGGAQAAGEARKFADAWARAEQTIVQASAKKNASIEADETRLQQIHDRRLRDAVAKQQAYFRSVEALEKSGGKLGLATGGGSQLADFQAQERAIRAKTDAMRDEEEAARRLAVRTESLLQAIDPVYAAQARYNNEIREAKLLLDAGAISAEQYGLAESHATAALEEATRAAVRNNQANGATRAALNNLSYQVGDIAQQFALGTPPMIIFAQQAGQVTGALGGLNVGARAGLAGALGSVLTILGGPWVQLLTAGAVVYASFRSRTDESTDALDKNASAAARVKEAHEILQRATDKYTETQEKVILRSIKIYEQLIVEEKQTLSLAKAKLASALADEEASRIRSSAPGQRGELGTLALDSATDRVAGLKALLDETDKRIAAIEKLVRGGYAALALETTVAAALDKTVAATQRYEHAIQGLLKQRENELISHDEFEAAAIKEGQRRDATIKAIREEAGERRKNEGEMRREMATVAQARKAILDLYPGARITATTNGRHTKGSFHYKGQAIDLQAVDGVSFEDFVASIKAKGFNIVEAIDEYKHPSKLSTGGHWHIAWSGGREAVSTLRDMERAQDSYATQLKSDLDEIVSKYDAAATSAATYAEEIEKIDRLQSGGLLSPSKATEYRSAALYAKLGIDPKGDMRTLMAERDAQRDNAYQAFNAQFGDNADRAEELKLELSMVGKSNEARERELTLLQVKQDYLRAGGEAGDAELRILQAQAVALYDQESVLHRISLAQQEFQQFGERTLDSIFNPDNWKNWGDLGKSILRDLENEFIKLAALNPLKNLLYGQNNPTLRDIFGIFSKETYSPDVSKSLANIGKNAAGTEYFGGGATWVGENGPEIAKFPAGTKIVPAGRARDLMGGGQPVRVSVPISIDATGADAAGLARVERQLSELQRTLPATIVTVWQDARDRRMVF